MGYGAQGVVYQAEHEKTKQICAIPMAKIEWMYRSCIKAIANNHSLEKAANRYA